MAGANTHEDSEEQETGEGGGTNPLRGGAGGLYRFPETTEVSNALDPFDVKPERLWSFWLRWRYLDDPELFRKVRSGHPIV